MTQSIRIHLLARAARSAGPSGTAADATTSRSIMSIAATSYGARPLEDMTTPTGFDPAAVLLFEAIVEGAYLAANADGTFDDEERRAFERVVVEACGGAVSSQQVTALVADLGRHLRTEGLGRRVASVATSLSKKEHAREVLRIAAIMAQVSEGVSAAERDFLFQLADQCGLVPDEVDAALTEAKTALGATRSE